MKCINRIITLIMTIALTSACGTPVESRQFTTGPYVLDTSMMPVLSDQSKNIYIPVTTETELSNTKEIGTAAKDHKVYAIDSMKDWIAADTEIGTVIYRKADTEEKSDRWDSFMIAGNPYSETDCKAWSHAIACRERFRLYLNGTVEEAETELKGKSEAELADLFEYGSAPMEAVVKTKELVLYRGTAGTLAVRMSENKCTAVELYPTVERAMTAEDGEVFVTMVPTKKENVYLFTLNTTINKEHAYTEIHNSAYLALLNKYTDAEEPDYSDEQLDTREIVDNTVRTLSWRYLKPENKADLIKELNGLEVQIRVASGIDPDGEISDELLTAGLQIIAP